MRYLLVPALAFSLAASPALAQSLHQASPAARPLQDAVRAEASRFVAAESAQGSSGDYMPGGMKPAYFWTSIGLMAAGAGYLLSGALVSTECSALTGLRDSDCGGVGKAVIGVGAGLAGAGVLVFVMGKSKARAAGNPEISFGPGSVAVRSRLTLKF